MAVLNAVMLQWVCSGSAEESDCGSTHEAAAAQSAHSAFHISVDTRELQYMQGPEIFCMMINSCSICLNIRDSGYPVLLRKQFWRHVLYSLHNEKTQ